MLFYLGTHRPNWLALTSVPLFVSRRTMFKRRTFPRALGIWALDSGGFSELSQQGQWTVSARQYVDEVRRFAREIGNLQWAAIQDHMCEPVILSKTGKTVKEHQDLTIKSLLELRSIDPGLPWAPVIQGWNFDDYHRHIDQYQKAGVDLEREPIVGVGSVCRREATRFATALMQSIAGRGIKAHGFGLKSSGLRSSAAFLCSSDSMAWSFAARKRGKLPGCTHKSCANCIRYAMRWRQDVLKAIEVGERRAIQPDLFGGFAC